MASEEQQTERRGGSTFLPMAVGIASVVIILAAVHGASQIVSQFLMAFVIAVSIAPLQRWLIKRGAHPTVAFIITVIATLVGIGTAIVVIVSSLNNFIGDLPQYEEQFAQLQGQITAALSSLGVNPSSGAATADTSALAKMVAEVAAWLVSAFTNFGFMLALAIFMLLESTFMPAKVKAIATPISRAPLDRFVGNVRNYVVVTAWVNFLVAAVDTALLFVMGVPYPVLWGALAFLFGFIPSVGFMLSLVGPALMALLVSGPQAALVVIVAFIVINGGIQNILLPRQMGEGTDLSAAVVFGSLLFWGYILGPVGAILSVPMTMIVRLSLESSESTLGLSYLMSSGRHPFAGVSSETGDEQDGGAD
jgi:AI-2 transport protein TqsA